MTNPNDDVIAEFRANSGTVTQAMGGALVGLDLILLHHPGRSSGLPHITPVAYMPYEDGYLLLGSFAGAATEPQWVRNVESTRDHRGGGHSQHDDDPHGAAGRATARPAVRERPGTLALRARLRAADLPALPSGPADSGWRRRLIAM